VGFDGLFFLLEKAICAHFGRGVFCAGLDLLNGPGLVLALQQHLDQASVSLHTWTKKKAGLKNSTYVMTWSITTPCYFSSGKFKSPCMIPALLFTFLTGRCNSTNFRQERFVWKLKEHKNKGKGVSTLELLVRFSTIIFTLSFAL